MDHRTVYIDLDHARLEHSREGIEVETETEHLVLNGTADAFAALLRLATIDTARSDGEVA
ncbi:hypothetical protein [Brachybacterium kimchii]|uniref:Uncharacterized protein n=1 Tax=Brachybacterium kimchii TaxID=2942909 RepID=A0ABY4NBC4_9MICO|nr:hypothetical protein [Brachybacterium kimchii]UQN30679.1 hypothetical protein M4486_05080 [Brachybacterium kimchii]